MTNEDNITYIGNPEDVVYLKTKLLPVNIRLLQTSARYRDTIRTCVDHIVDFCATTMEGYKKPHGMSGANCGIPFNIIACTYNRGKADEGVGYMINPVIVEYLGKLVETTSNCGSIRLKEPIKVLRYEAVTVTYYDMGGTLHVKTFDRNNCAFTIQHEVDHNNGILITDYKPKFVR